MSEATYLKHKISYGEARHISFVSDFYFPSGKQPGKTDKQEIGHEITYLILIKTS